MKWRSLVRISHLFLLCGSVKKLYIYIYISLNGALIMLLFVVDVYLFPYKLFVTLYFYFLLFFLTPFFF
jgi:hypothetical protein